jgi:hypothetical protein
MTDAAPEAPAQEQPNSEADAKTDESKPDETDWKAEARKWEQRAKENGAKATEYDKARKAAMTDAERATAEAEERGRTAATQQFSARLAKSEIRAEAKDAGADLDGVFEYLDLSRFVGEDGEPDAKAIKTFVSQLPQKDPTPPSFDGGTRTTPPAQQGMSSLIRKAAGRA